MNKIQRTLVGVAAGLTLTFGLVGCAGSEGPEEPIQTPVVDEYGLEVDSYTFEVVPDPSRPGEVVGCLWYAKGLRAGAMSCWPLD